MEAAETAGERRAILQAIGPVAKLVERKVGTYKNGKDLTKKFIEVKPYPWLEKLKKMLKKLPQKSTRDLTVIYRGKTTEEVPYIRIGGSYWARTSDLTNVNRAL